MNSEVWMLEMLSRTKHGRELILKMLDDALDALPDNADKAGKVDTMNAIPIVKQMRKEPV